MYVIRRNIIVTAGVGYGTAAPQDALMCSGEVHTSTASLQLRPVGMTFPRAPIAQDCPGQMIGASSVT